MAMNAEWAVSPQTLHEQRRAKRICTRCGEHPRMLARELCQRCHGLVVERDRYLRQRRIDEARKIAAEVEARRNRVRREVTIQVGWKKNRPVMQTFIVMNSYGTESSFARIQSSPNPFLR